MEMVAARELAQKNRELAMLTAVIQIHESWVLFQKGLRKEALRLLAHAEADSQEYRSLSCAGQH